jgi:outer membrane murein-binding lipoprotein Lpp
MSSGRSVMAAAACVAALSVAGGSSAADPEVEALREQLEALKARVEALERQRLPQGGRLPTARSDPSDEIASKPIAADTGNSVRDPASSWARVERGMSRTQVEALIGPPRQEMNIDNRLVWYYVYPRYGRGSVFFTSDNRVSSVQQPQFGWGR